MRDGWQVWIKKSRKSKQFSYERYPGFNYVSTGKYAYHWHKVVTDEAELERIRRNCKKDRLLVEITPMALVRSSSYRKQFLEDNPGPWRCVYCYRKLDSDSVTVDHLVPVAKAKSSGIARLLLKLGKCETVNDQKNLRASCKPCNSRKGQKMGLWFIRGLFGKSPIWHITIRVLVILLLAGALLFAVEYFDQIWVAIEYLRDKVWAWSK